MRVLVHKANKQELALIFDPIEMMTNQHRVQEWLQAVQQQPGFLQENSPEVDNLQAAPHGPEQVILLKFKSPEALKTWMEGRWIPFITQEEYERIRKEVQP